MQPWWRAESPPMVIVGMLPTANTSRYSGRMKTLELAYEFTVHVAGLDIEDESKLSRLSDEQFTVVPFASDGLLMLAVETTAKSPDAALRDFKSFLNGRSPGIKIMRIDLDLVSLSQIAERLAVSREAVRLWASGQRRQGFPGPFTSAGQSLLWAWSEVFGWLTPEETSGDAHPLPLDLIERMNGSYAQERTKMLVGRRSGSVRTPRRIAAI